MAGGAAVLALSWEKLRPAVQLVGTLRKMVQDYGQAEKASLEAMLEAANNDEAALEAEIRNATPAGQLAGFIQERAVGDAYRSRLGIMTQIHRDFEIIAKLLRRAADQPGEKDLVGDTLPRVDRIVLYIDDLDRCPPERVVEVMEAIHLLLALPLFVVVVAVDPRWLLRSLTHHYQGILTGPSDRAGELWSATPMQYLEKIFQVPFTLAPVATDGYQRLVDSLTVSDLAETPAPTSTAQEAASQAKTGGGSAARSLWRPVVRQLPSARVVDRADPNVLALETYGLVKHRCSCTARAPELETLG